MTLSDEEVVEMIRRVANRIDDMRLYYELKRLRFRAHTRTRQYVKVCIAITKLRLPITAVLVCAVIGSSPKATVEVLHNLGDKGLLDFDPSSKKKWYVWRPSSLLLELADRCLPVHINIYNAEGHLVGFAEKVGTNYHIYDLKGKHICTVPSDTPLKQIIDMLGG